MSPRGKRWRTVVSAALIAGAMTPTLLRWVRRTGAAHRAVNMRMTVVVPRPVHDVFEFCRDFENFPRLVNGLERVEDKQDGRSHWVVRAPSGAPIEWDATITKYVPNTVIGWESAAGAPVQAAGLMRFFPLSPQATRLDLSLTYLPRHTGLADAFSALLAGRNDKKLRESLAQAPEALASDAATSGGTS